MSTAHKITASGNKITASAKITAKPEELGYGE